MRSAPVESPWTAAGGERQEPAITPERCVHARVACSSCRACVDACPRGALRLDDESLGLEPDACDGCALCVPACPTGAVVLPLPAADGTERCGARLLLCCERGGAASRQVVPCVHALGLRGLLRLYHRGVRMLVVSTGDCDRCDRGARVRVASHLHGLGLMLRSRGLPAMELRSVSATAWRSMRRSDGAVVSGRRRFLSAWTTLRDDPGLSPAPGDSLPAVSDADVQRWVPRIDPLACDGCDACAELCPEDALSVQVLDGDEYYRTEAARCSGCGVCTDVCERSAVRLDAWHPGGPSMLPLRARRCRACGVRYHRPATAACTGDLCRVCARTNHYRNLHQVLDS